MGGGNASSSTCDASKIKSRPVASYSRHIVRTSWTRYAQLTAPETQEYLDAINSHFGTALDLTSLLVDKR